jgi:transposase-like protein
MQGHRDTPAAEQFFRRLLSAAAGVPHERITTDKLGSYAAARARLPEVAGVEHLQVRSTLRRSNRVEQAHRPTQLRERAMRRFKSAAWHGYVRRTLPPSGQRDNADAPQG